MPSGYPYTINEVIAMLPKFVSLDTSTYKKLYSKARFIDSEYGEFWSSAGYVIKGEKLHKNRRVQIKPARLMDISAIIMRLPPHITLDESTYKNTTTPARFIDSEYGEFWTKPTFIINRKHGHPVRGKKKAGLSFRLTEKEIKNRLPDHICIDFNTYQGGHTKARFIDSEYGEFWARPAHVMRGQGHHPIRLQEKIKSGIFAKYGTISPMHNLDVALRCAKSQKRSVIVIHWETNEELVVTGSYEYFTVKYLNENKIRFKWQPKLFQTPLKTKKGAVSMYRPDLYMIDSDLWVEVKGNFRDTAKLKWDWFHKEYPNSELWTGPVLEQKGIINSHPEREFAIELAKFKSRTNTST